MKSSLSQKEKAFIKSNAKYFYIEELARMFLCDKKTICNYCYYHNISFKSTRLTQDNIDYILNYHNKFTVDELADKLQTKKVNIERIYRKFGLNKVKKEKPDTKLTKRELEVINLICKKGVFKPRKLAELLYISFSTVKTHISNIYIKTSCNSLAELIYKYYNKQLISESEE